jgi:hypothetical protein
MSFVLHYQRLFKISVTEGAGGPGLAGFTLAPTPRCRVLLDNHQLVFRGREAGGEVYYRLNPLAADPLLGRISTRVRFTFCLLQTDAAFFARYKPDLTKSTGPQLYLDNLTATGGIQPADRETLARGEVVQSVDAVKLYPAVFVATADLSGGEPPTLFRVLNKFNPDDVVLEAPIISGGNNGRGFAKIDLSGKPAGPYTLTTDAAEATPRTIYLDQELAGAPLLGLVDIYWETPQNAVAAGGQAFRIGFAKR